MTNRLKCGAMILSDRYMYYLDYSCNAEPVVQLASFQCRFFHGEKPGYEAIVQLASFPCRLFHGEKPGYEAIVQLASFPGSFTGKSLGTRL